MNAHPVLASEHLSHSPSLVLKAARSGARWLGGRQARLFLHTACVVAVTLLTGCSKADDRPGKSASASEPSNARKLPGITYWNEQRPQGPLSIHVVKIERNRADLAFVSTIARNTVLGLGTLTSQLRTVPESLGKPVTAINGDFYVVDHGSYLGDPRGLQIINGELVSSPGDQVCFWMDANQEPHAEHVESKLSFTWPDGSTSPLKLNEERGARDVVLYTPRLGASTRTSGGREVVVAREGESPWLPLAAGKNYTVKVTEVRETGDTPTKGDRMVLSFGPKESRAASLTVGSILKFSTETEPSVAGAKTAIGGGNIMVHQGQAVEIQVPSNGSYKYRSVFEKHPRSAIGFNKTHIFLVLVDGRQPELSMGMTLADLGAYMKRLGCDEAMNFDGGGSSTLWLDGRVVNSPCNGGEREIGNALVVVRTAAAPAKN